MIHALIQDGYNNGTNKGTHVLKNRLYIIIIIIIIINCKWVYVRWKYATIQDGRIQYSAAQYNKYITM